MTRYRTKQNLPLAAGTIVQLSDAQARDRRLRIVPLGEGRYRLNELMVFKRGEELGIEGELPKIHQDYIEALTVPVQEEVSRPMPMSMSRKKKD